MSKNNIRYRILLKYMKHDTISKIRSIALSILMIISIAGVGIPATAQPDIGLSLDFPNETTVGEATDFDMSISAPSPPGRWNSIDVTINTYSDGKLIKTKTPSISSGETISPGFEHVFDESGEKDMRVEVSVAFDGVVSDRTFAASRSKSITVQKPDVKINGPISASFEQLTQPTVDEELTIGFDASIPRFTVVDEGNLQAKLYVNGEQVDSRSIDQVKSGDSVSDSIEHSFDSVGKNKVTVKFVLTVQDISRSKTISKSLSVLKQQRDLTGASFTVPTSLEDEVKNYRIQTQGSNLEGIPSKVTDNIPSAYAFVLTTQNGPYIVLTSQQTDPGEANVRGYVLDRDVNSNMNFGVIVATNVEQKNAASTVSVNDVALNADEYRFNLVKITANHRRISMLTDPDLNSSEEIEFNTEAGVLTENPVTARSLFGNIGESSRSMTEGVSRSSERTVDPSALSEIRGSYIRTIGFRESSWVDTDSAVTGIVIPPGSTAAEFMTEYYPSTIDYTGDTTPIIYVTKSTIPTQNVNSVREIKLQADTLDGQAVSVRANVIHRKTSVQETIEHSTACENRRAQVPTPQGPVCINIPVDVLIRSGVAWDSEPRSREDTVFILGASSGELDKPFELVEPGQYQIQAEVVSTSRVSGSLPQGSILMIYEMKRVDDLSINQRSEGIIYAAQNQIKNRLYTQIADDEGSIQTSTYQKSLTNLEGDTTNTVDINSQSRSPVSLSSVGLTTIGSVDTASISVNKLSSFSSAPSTPPTSATGLMRISTSVPDSTVRKATLRFKMYEAVTNNDDLAVYRYNDNEWQELDTTINNNENINYLTAETSGLSYFTIAPSTRPNPTSTSEEQSDSADENRNNDLAGRDSSDSSPDDVGNDDPTSQGEDDTTQDGQNTATAEPISGNEIPGFGLVAPVVAIMLFILYRGRNSR
jgi:PGF-pre-PGF domain-containing protein